MRLNFTIRDCTDSNRPKVHDYVAMLRRILTQYPHAEFVFQFAPDGIHEEPMLTNEDLVLGIRPEFLSITGGGNVECEIYGAMPTGMESTVKVRIGEYLLTGVVFGSTLFTIGSKHLLDITGSSVMLFDRSSGRRITSGTLKLL